MREIKKLAAKYWHVAASLIMVAMSVGVQQQRFVNYGTRLDAVEATKPDVTAALTQRTSEDVAALRTQMNKVGEDVGAIRVDLARLCVRMEMQPIREAGNQGVQKGGGG